MDVTVGTFNLNNLFSRFNFKGEIDAIRSLDTSLDGELKYDFGAADTWKLLLLKVSAPKKWRARGDLNPCSPAFSR
jgi:hypothetical protein